MISGVSNIGDFMDNLASFLFLYFYRLETEDIDWRQRCFCTPVRDSTCNIGLTPTHHNYPITKNNMQ